MKSAIDILIPKLKEAEQNEKKGLVCDNKLYIIQAMNEFADQFKTNKLFEFVYCGMTEESSYATISVHRTREGAETAMEKHKAEEKIKYDEKMKRYVESWEKEGHNEKTINELSKSIGEFGRFQDWGINEIEIED